MFFSPRISTRELAQLCHRLAISVDAGIDARKIWSREAEQAQGPAKSRFELISQAVNQGESLQDALSRTGEFFPVLFRELVAVGEYSGGLDKVFAQLAENYEYRLKLRRQFLGAITWPLVELGLAVLVIGVFIWFAGMIRDMTNSDFDPLGMGLYGGRGVIIYVVFIFAVVVFIWMIIRAINRGLVWVRPIQHTLMRLPTIGNIIETLALSRLAWSMYITLNAGMEIRRAIRLSLGSTNNAYYTDHIEEIDAELLENNTLHDSFVKGGCFPTLFLDSIAVGEHTGKTAEAMATLSRQYREQAKFALKTLSVIGGFAVWALMAAIMVYFILRMAFFYLSAIGRMD
jgi:type II secretory pathway component PulF